MTQLCYNLIEKTLSSLSKERSFLMGAAIFMVLLFHICGRYNLHPLNILTAKGYYGVDIFLFLSGYGLTSSFEKNTKPIFFKNRAIRILPIFYILALVKIILYSFDNDIKLFDIIISLLGLSYFKYLGGIRIDWFLGALIILYILFPLIYKIISNYKEKALLVISAFSICTCIIVPLWWEHQCLIGRLPIFALGVYTFIHKKNISNLKKIYLTYIIIGITFLITEQFILYWRFKFLTPAFFSPLLIIALLTIKKPTYISKPFCFLGKHTLEIYVANCITVAFCRSLSENLYTQALLDIIFTSLISCLLFYYSIFVKKITSKKTSV